MIKSSFKQIRKDYLLPLLFQYVILAALIALFMVCVKRGPLLEEAELVGDETSSPTVGRLAYGVLSLLASLGFTVVASKAAKTEHDVRAFWFGFPAGILLWQAIGEISWHFSVGGIHFVPLENVTSFPLAILFVLLLIYGKRHHSFDWGVWIMLLSFACNWFGHYITLGIYPFVEPYFTSRQWNVSISVAAGALFFLYSVLFLLFRARTTRGRMLASLMSYIAIAVIYFGFAEG